MLHYNLALCWQHGCKQFTENVEAFVSDIIKIIWYVYLQLQLKKQYHKAIYNFVQKVGVRILYNCYKELYQLKL